MTLARQSNCFDMMRLIAALMVIYSHGYVMVGLPQPGVLGINHAGGLAVSIFFAISGYLITQSWLSDPHLPRFLKRRALRIFPALIVLVLLSLFVLGPLLTSVPASVYWTNRHTYGYLRNIILQPTYNLSGVFLDAPVPNTVNASLWSLPVEFSMYLLVGACGVIGLMRYRFIMAAVAIALSFGCLYFGYVHPGVVVFYGVDMYQAAIVIPYFLTGCSLYLLRDYLPFTLPRALIVFVILLALPDNKALTIGAWFAISYLTLAFCTAHDRFFRIPKRVGDLSYGIYIYGFPMQQIVYQLWHDRLGMYEMMIASALLAGVAAFASWHLIEQPALRLKPVRRDPAPELAISEAVF